jgi:hypothetical protein
VVFAEYPDAYITDGIHGIPDHAGVLAGHLRAETSVCRAVPKRGGSVLGNVEPPIGIVGPIPDQPVAVFVNSEAHK